MIQRRLFIQRAGACGLLGTGLPVSFGATPVDASDAGEPYTWKSVPFGGGGFIDGLVFHPGEKGLLYARTDIGGAYRFETATKSWTPLLDELSKSQADLSGVLSLAVDPNDANRVYLACGLYLGAWARNAALLASNDRGATWQIHELGIKLGGNSAGRAAGERLQVDPNNGEILVLGTTQDGLLISNNRGHTFTHLEFPARHVSLVLFDPRSGMAGNPTQTLWAGAFDKPGLYVSHDGGSSFVREPGTPAQAPQRAALGSDGTLYVTFALGDSEIACNPGYAKSGSVWKRDPAGYWTDITPDKTPGFGWSGIDVDRQMPGRLVVSTIERWSVGDDVFISIDNGAHWKSVGAHSHHDASAYPWLVNYMRSEDKMGHWLADIKLDPFNGERAVYGTGYGLWLTDNLGAALKGETVKWDFAVANLEETSTRDLKSPSGGATLLGAMADVAGGAWDDTTKTPGAGLFTPTTQTNHSVDFAELKPAIVVRTADQIATGGWWSADGSVTWKPFGPSPRLLKSAQGADLGAGSIAVSANGTSFVWAPEKQQALCSHDHGKSWVPSAGWPATADVELIPVADRKVDGVFYVLDRDNGQILLSVDGGLSFRPGIIGLTKVASWQSAQILSAPGNVRDLWVALPDVLLHMPSIDEPAITIKNVLEPWKIALGKAAPASDYHSVYVWGKLLINGNAVEGLFRSDDAGKTFKRIDDDRHRYGRLNSMTGDPLEHGTVYLAPEGRGVIVGKPRQDV